MSEYTRRYKPGIRRDGGPESARRHAHDMSRAQPLDMSRAQPPDASRTQPPDASRTQPHETPRAQPLEPPRAQPLKPPRAQPLEPPRAQPREPPRAQPRDTSRAQPFHSAEEAWLWTMAALRARRDGARYTANRGLFGRPCEPDDVIRCLDALYRRHRIDLLHARILRVWGERQMSPDPGHANERCDYRLWREALDSLESSLRAKGIVA
jgi:hypothetical protein